MPVKNSDLIITTQQALEDNIKTLTVAGIGIPATNAGNNEPIPRKRGRPRKIPKPIEINIEEDIIVCPKCGLDDPGDWSQCSGSCPMPESPHYQVANNTPFAVSLPPDPWGKWKRFNVSETSKVFLDWYAECEKIVLSGWTLKIGNMNKYIRISMVNGDNSRPFAFVRKTTGDIHTPATKKYPFDHFAGNILDPETRLSIMTPYGVQAHWAFTPTHPDYQENLAFQLSDDYTADNKEDDANDE